MTRSREAILRLFRVADNRAGEIKPQSSIFPAYTAPVVRKAHDGERELVQMSWGFVLLQPGKAPRRVTNARDDKVLTSRFWKPSFEARRCIVPASSYCEPNGQSPATWYWFALNGDHERPLIWPLLEHTRHDRKAQGRSDLLCLVYRVLDLLLVELFLRSIQRDQLDH